MITMMNGIGQSLFKSQMNRKGIAFLKSQSSNLLQKLTTAKPDNRQIEVAIKAVQKLV